ncbi:hypothetical protein ACFLXE_07785, partial [Chloroflexota bacterium]
MPLFGTSGIRGVVGEDITLDLCREVGMSLGTMLSQGARVCLATDTRLSRDMLKDSIFTGLLSCGVDITDLGILPTPVLALLTREWGFDAGIMVTASHNPPEFNGIKLFNGDSIGYSPDQEREVERLYREKAFLRGDGGVLRQGQGMLESYLRFIRHRLPAEGLNRNLKIVADPGNGAASGFASKLFTELELDVIPINDTPDGNFPGRKPEPMEETLRCTVEFLREMNADLAVCFDGDADRVVFCDKGGFWGFNEATAYISRLVVQWSGNSRVASTVESGRLLDLALQDMGVEVVRGKVGDVHLAYLTRETGAAIGTEPVGVYVVPEVGYYPDSMFASLILLSRIEQVAEVREFFRRIPQLLFDKRKVPCPNQLKEAVMGEIGERVGLLGPARINDLDGIRLEFEDSWTLIRASGTEPVIRVIAESTS